MCAVRWAIRGGVVVVALVGTIVQSRTCGVCRCRWSAAGSIDCHIGNSSRRRGRGGRVLIKIVLDYRLGVIEIVDIVVGIIEIDVGERIDTGREPGRTRE